MPEDMPPWFRPRVAIGVALLATTFFAGTIVGMDRSPPIKEGFGTPDEQSLEIQEGIREANDDMSSAAWWAVGLSLATAVLLGFTLRETRRTARAAIASASTTAKTARARLFVEIEEDGFWVRNYGQTPATKVAVEVHWAVSRVPRPILDDWSMHPAPNTVHTERGLMSVVSPGNGRRLDIAPEPRYFTELIEFVEGPINLYWVTLIYQDVFGDGHRTACEITMRPLADNRGLPSTVELLDAT